MSDARISSKEEFFRGMRTVLAPLFAAAPFGALFGALAIDNGLSVGQALLMSATVFAGASQMVGIELFGANVAPWLIVLSIFAVNFRHVLYSAVAGRRTPQWSWLQRAFAFHFLIDPQFAETERRAESGHKVTFAWFMGGGLAWWTAWLAATWVGALFGKLIENPEQIGIDFLLPIYFLGLVMGFRKRVNWLPVVLASGVASIAAYHFIGSPWHVSIGAIAGVALAAILGQPKAHRIVV